MIHATPPAMALRTGAFIGLLARTYSHEFDGDRRRFAAADAEARDAALLSPRAPRVQTGSPDSGPRRADRMPERTGSAVDIHLLMIQAQVFHRGHRHRRKRLVDLVQ